MAYDSDSDDHRLEMEFEDKAIFAAENDEHQALDRLGDKGRAKLVTYLQKRLKEGMDSRMSRITRYRKIDMLISTWQQYDPEDTKRVETEESTGINAALRENLPLLASHLEDMVAYYAETLSPVGNPIVSASGENKVADIIKRITRDIIARNYYGEVAATCRSLLKYNIGGMHVEWDRGSNSKGTLARTQAAGNVATALDPYNTLWDGNISDPKDLSAKAEWAAVSGQANRVTLMRNHGRGAWYGIEEILAKKKNYGHTDGSPLRLWLDTAATIPTGDGMNGKDRGNGANTIDWAAFNLSLPSDGVDYKDRSNFEHTIMYVWLAPDKHGLLDETEQAEIASSGQNPAAFLELWRFELINNEHIVVARPHVPRARTLQGEVQLIPFFLDYLTRDQLKRAQRSSMELVVPFQRLASALFGLGIENYRMGISGTRVVAKGFLTPKQLEGSPNKIIEAADGRDVRAGIHQYNGMGQGAEAFQQVAVVMGLKSDLFPNQSLPAQVAGLDRAVTNQVSAVVHGAQQALRLSLRLIDAAVFAPTRLEFVRNLQRFESTVTQDISDEQIASDLGSGIESLEAERVTEALWRILMAVIQNREAMDDFDVPMIMQYLGQVYRVKIDFGRFARRQGPTNVPSLDQNADPAAGTQPADAQAQAQAAAAQQQQQAQQLPPGM